ncbi:hypothetical protein DH2020_037588 [Rehmannia glutinosa]|uniref:non-specific serine/threonine protein kinase n=1 Tax=Rehmannia glutinosa TaxID=99300 RepID=A0ABR0V1A8_REHGL
MDRAAMTLGPGMDMPIMHDSDRYDLVREIGSGNFGVARLMRISRRKSLLRLSILSEGIRFWHMRFYKIDENVQREIINHRSLRHPNIVRFKEVLLTPTHLAIVMEYASGGELFERISNAGRFNENEQICHRDLKLENTLLDGSPAPRLKICDFGYSKSSLLHSQPKSTVGTPAYIAPEVLHRKEYDGKIADVWSCGVTLYVMLVGSYPFEDPENPKDFRKTIQRVLNVQYSIPGTCCNIRGMSASNLRIFVADPEQVAFLNTFCLCDIEQPVRRVGPATAEPRSHHADNLRSHYTSAGLYNLDMMDSDMDDMYSDPDDLDVDSSGEFIYAM